MAPKYVVRMTDSRLEVVLDSPIQGHFATQNCFTLNDNLQSRRVWYSKNSNVLKIQFPRFSQMQSLRYERTESCYLKSSMGNNEWVEGFSVDAPLALGDDEAPAVGEHLPTMWEVENSAITAINKAKGLQGQDSFKNCEGAALGVVRLFAG